MKKIAYVHDWIYHYWWAESLFKELIDRYWAKSARIYTLFSPYSTFTTDTGDVEITTALPKRCNRLMTYFSKHKRPFFSRLFDYRNLMPIYPILMKLLRKKITRYSPDICVISSFAAVKNIVPPSSHKPLAETTILYLHSPMQYIWGNYTEYCKKLWWIKKRLFKMVTGYLRKRDKKPRTYTTVYANSSYTAQSAKKTYGLGDITIWYPSIHPDYLTTPVQLQPDEYYLYIWRLVKFIRETDRIIELFNHLQLPLIVMWSWPDEEYLKSLAGDSIIFIGNISDPQEKIAITKKAKWLINLAKESCGIATMESLALGVPVFWYNQWWTKELVQEGMWQLVDSKEHNSLLKAFQNFSTTHYDRTRIQKTFRAYYITHKNKRQ